MPYNVKDFPPSDEIERVAKEDDYFSLLSSEPYDYKGRTDRGVFRLKEFFSNDEKKAEILAKALNIAPLIADAGTDFLFGGPFSVEVDDERDDKEELDKRIADILERNNLQERFEESSTLFQGIGHTHFKIYGRGQGSKTQAIIEEIPYSYWYPNWSGVALGAETNNPRLVVHLTNVDEEGKQTKYIYIEDYFFENEKVVIEYALYEEKAGAKISDPVDLKDKFPELLPKNAKQHEQTKRYRETTKLTEMPIVSIQDKKTVLDRYGQSIYKRIMPLLEEINDRLTQVSIQFLKHLNAKLQLPESAIVRDQRTGEVKNIDLEVILAQQGDPEAKYITNDNPLIEDAFKHMDRLIRQCAKLTQTPDTFLLEDEKGGVEKAEALKVRLMSFLKRVARYQRKYEEALRKLIRRALTIEGVEKANELPLKITFDLGLPKDWQYDVDVWSAAMDAGLASRETAIRSFQDIDGPELEEEMKKIDAEEKERMQSQTYDSLKPGDNPDDEE